MNGKQYAAEDVVDQILEKYSKKGSNDNRGDRRWHRGWYRRVEVRSVLGCNTRRCLR